MSGHASRRSRSQHGHERRERHERIAERAYYEALKRDFEPGRHLEDWLEAEQEVGALVRPRQRWRESTQF